MTLFGHYFTEMEVTWAWTAFFGFLIWSQLRAEITRLQERIGALESRVR